MPFDFGAPRTDMGDASIRALEGTEADIAAAYGLGEAAAYEHVGVSSMNGETDETSEVVEALDFETIISFAEAHRLARVSFWSVNRDRACKPARECSGIAQAPYAFSDVVARF